MINEQGQEEWSSRPSTFLKAPYLRNGLRRKANHTQSQDSHLAPNQLKKEQLWDARVKHILNSECNVTYA